MTKIVINRCYGGFSISDAAEKLYIERKGITDPDFYSRYIERDDPVLVQIVEELGDKANGSCAKLFIVELDKGTLYRIDEYDGMEWVETQDMIDWKVA